MGNLFCILVANSHRQNSTRASICYVWRTFLGVRPMSGSDIWQIENKALGFWIGYIYISCLTDLKRIWKHAENAWKCFHVSKPNTVKKSTRCTLLKDTTGLTTNHQLEQPLVVSLPRYSKKHSSAMSFAGSLKLKSRFAEHLLDKRKISCGLTKYTCNNNSTSIL